MNTASATTIKTIAAYNKAMTSTTALTNVQLP